MRSWVSVIYFEHCTSNLKQSQIELRPVDFSLLIKLHLSLFPVVIQNKSSEYNFRIFGLYFKSLLMKPFDVSFICKSIIGACIQEIVCKRKQIGAGFCGS